MRTIDQAEVESKRIEIANQMAELGRRLERSIDDDLVVWVIQGALGCAHRPLRHHPSYAISGFALPPEAKQLVLD